MSDNEIIKRDTISDAGLNPVPEMYLSPTDTPSPKRLTQILVDNNLPYIVEFLEGTLYTSPQRIYFNEKYEKIPLVTGLLYYKFFDLYYKIGGTSSPIAAFMLEPPITITNEYIEIGDNFTFNIGGSNYKFRIYNISVTP